MPQRIPRIIREIEALKTDHRVLVHKVAELEGNIIAIDGKLSRRHEEMRQQYERMMAEIEKAQDYMIEQRASLRTLNKTFAVLSAVVALGATLLKIFVH